VQLWLVHLTESCIEKLCIYVHVDLSVHMIWFYLYLYLIFIQCMFPVDFFPITFSAVFQSMALLC